jgi:hypothetical protein
MIYLSVYCTQSESLLDCCVLKALQNRAGRADRLAEMQSGQAAPAKRLLSVTAVVRGEVRTVH